MEDKGKDECNDLRVADVISVSISFVICKKIAGNNFYFQLAAICHDIN